MSFSTARSGATRRRPTRASLLVALTLVACDGATALPDGEVLPQSPPKSDGPAGTTPPAQARLSCPVLVVGGGTGGVAAALAAARSGAEVCITEETDWLGGQLTAQALNASDDNKYVDSTGATASYARLRALMRAQYGGRKNPGGCWVSYLCAEPAAALAAIAELAAPAVEAGRLHVYYRVRPAAARRDGKTVTGVDFVRLADGAPFSIAAGQTLDATELGDVIALAGAAYRVGQEARATTGEADAPDQACGDCVQAFTWDAILERRPAGESHVIARPAGYGSDPWQTGFSLDKFPMFGAGSFWSYRRLVDGQALRRTDVAVINWDSNDYPYGSVIDKPAEVVALHLARARQRTLAFIYWLQTEADGHGYPSLMLRPDLTGTTDGLAKTQYVREGRRLVALTPVRIEDLSSFYRPGESRARAFSDSAGVGFYPFDMHRNAAPGTGSPRGHSLPYQVPFGALVPVAVDGLLAAAKDIGTTHMANSAYRLHPIEWAIGEAAGTLAALCLAAGQAPRAIVADEGRLRALQIRMLDGGAPLYWTDDVVPADPDWAAIQLVAAIGVLGGPEADTLHFRPDLAINRAQIADALVRALALPLVNPGAPTFSDVPTDFWAYRAIETLAAQKIVSGVGGGRYAPAAAVTWDQLRSMIDRALGPAAAKAAVPGGPSANPCPRRGAARALATVVRLRLHLP